MANNKKVIKIKTKKIIIGIIIGIILAGLTVFTLAFVLLVLFIAGPPAKVTKNINDYSKIYEEMGVQSGLIVFPDEISANASDVKFYHYYRDTLFDPTVETFLQCTYTDEEYAKEIGRLENAHKTYSGRTEYLQKDKKNRFNYPAYIAIDYAPISYEYALLTGDNQITYFFVMFKDKTHTDKKYLPNDFMVDKTPESSYDVDYSIYIVSDSGYSRELDYTKDEYITVNNCHYKEVGDYAESFLVRTEYNERNEEIITSYEYSYPWTDNNSENPDVDEYHDLDGYEFVSLDINYDTKEAYIEYKVNGENEILTVKIPDGDK